MALDVVSNAFQSLLSLLWVSVLYAIPVFIIVFLIGKRLFRFFHETHNRSWLQSALLSTYLIVFVVLIIAFFLPVWEAGQSPFLAQLPPDIAPTLFDQIGQFVFGIIRIALVSVLFSILLLPLILLGAFVFDWLETRIPTVALRLFLSSWAVLFIVLAVILFWLPWVIPSLLYLLFWA